VMVEDNVPSDIWFASTRTNEYGASRDVTLFASLADPGAEGTGIYFSPIQPDVLYVNVQHSAADDGDATWAIRKDRGRRQHAHDEHRDHRRRCRSAASPTQSAASGCPFPSGSYTCSSVLGFVNGHAGHCPPWDYCDVERLSVYRPGRALLHGSHQLL